MQTGSPSTRSGADAERDFSVVLACRAGRRIPFFQNNLPNPKTRVRSNLGAKKGRPGATTRNEVRRRQEPSVRRGGKVCVQTCAKGISTRITDAGWEG